MIRETIEVESGCGRKKSKKLKNTYPNYIIMLHDAPKHLYWVYDNCAEKLVSSSCTIGELRYNREGLVSAIIQDTDIQSICDELCHNNMSHIITDGVIADVVTFTDEDSISDCVCNEPDEINAGVPFNLVDDAGKTLKCILGDDNSVVKRLIHVGEITQIMYVPLNRIDDCMVITPDSAMSSILLHKHFGETVEYNGVRYSIQKIR